MLFPRIRKGRGPARQPPDGYTVVPLAGLHYPVQLAWDEQHRLCLTGFLEHGAPVCYARHGGAIDYLYRHVSNTSRN